MPAIVPEEIRVKQLKSLPNIEFIGWIGEYKNSRSKANVRCKIDGSEWSSTVHSLNAGYGCKKCARLIIENAKRIPESKRIEQINSLSNIEFLGWACEYKGNRSRAIVKCKICKREWTATVQTLIDKASGCKDCSQIKVSNSQRVPEDIRIIQINSMPNLTFLKWCDGEYKNNHSKAYVACQLGHKWSAYVTNLLRGSGCPFCSKKGYNINAEGTLYALRSECGSMIKIGISNKPKQRHRQLEKATPFSFYVIEQVTGDGVKIAEMELYFHRKYASAGLSGFDGATEWLMATDELLTEIRKMGH